MSPAAAAADLRVDRAGPTAIITLGRPPSNKLDLDLVLALARTLKECDDDAGIRSIVLTGEGEMFCGGADMDRIRATSTEAEFARETAALFGLFPRLATPVIAAVNGDALAGGFGLMCSADIIVMSSSARVGTVEAQFGSWPFIAQVPASRRTPAKALIRNALTGRPFTADEALALGIVDEVVPAYRLLARAVEWAGSVTGGAAAIADGRRLLYELYAPSYDEMLRAGADAFARFATRSTPTDGSD